MDGASFPAFDVARHLPAKELRVLVLRDAPRRFEIVKTQSSAIVGFNGAVARAVTHWIQGYAHPSFGPTNGVAPAKRCGENATIGSTTSRSTRDGPRPRGLDPMSVRRSARRSRRTPRPVSGYGAARRPSSRPSPRPLKGVGLRRSPRATTESRGPRRVREMRSTASASTGRQAADRPAQDGRRKQVPADLDRPPGGGGDPGQAPGRLDATADDARSRHGHPRAPRCGGDSGRRSPSCARTRSTHASRCS